MPDRSDYQPLPQSADDEPDLDPEDFSTATSPTQPRARGIRRMNAPGAIDLRKLDAAFKRFVVSLSFRYASEPELRWTESIAQKMKRKKKVEDIHVKKEIIRSVFDPPFVSTAASGGVVSFII
jgi:phosphatidylinositol 4-kinase type 2